MAQASRSKRKQAEAKECTTYHNNYSRHCQVDELELEGRHADELELEGHQVVVCQVCGAGEQRRDFLAAAGPSGW